MAPKTRGGDRSTSIYVRAALGAAVALICLGGLGGGVASSATGGKATATKLKLEDVSPNRIFFRGKHPATFKYEIGGRQTEDLRIAAVRKGHGAVRKWDVANVKPKTKYKLSWNGTVDHGKEVPKGKYSFRVEDASGQLDRSNADGHRSFGVYPDIFPVRGHHGYGDGWGAGRGHTGQDIFADCGTKEVAARAGKVAFVGNDGGGYGHYMVINTRGEKHAHLYAHMKDKPLVHKGDHVRTGESIGKVGASGNAQGCHLHFEYWDGNYNGGRPQASVTKHVKDWDRWS